MQRFCALFLRRALLAALTALILAGCSAPTDPTAQTTAMPTPANASAASEKPAIAADMPAIVTRGAASSAADLATLGRAVCALTMRETEQDLAAVFGTPLNVNTPNPDTRDVVFRSDGEVALRAVFVKGAMVDVSASRLVDMRAESEREVASQMVVETHGFATGKTTLDEVDRVLGTGEGVLFRRTSGRLSREQLEAARAKRPDLTMEQLEALFSSCLEKRRYPFGKGSFTVLTFSGDTLFQ